MKPFDWDDLRVFLAVHRHGSLSSAARALKVSQPTVGRRLAGLEDSLASRLFDRLPDGFLPTPAGEELLAYAEEMEKAANAVLRRQPSFSDRVQGTVRISVFEQVSPFIISHLDHIRRRLPAVMDRLITRHPTGYRIRPIMTVRLSSRRSLSVNGHHVVTDVIHSGAK